MHQKFTFWNSLKKKRHIFLFPCHYFNLSFHVLSCQNSQDGCSDLTSYKEEKYWWVQSDIFMQAWKRDVYDCVCVCACFHLTSGLCWEKQVPSATLSSLESCLSGPVTGTLWIIHATLVYGNLSATFLYATRSLWV